MSKTIYNNNNEKVVAYIISESTTSSKPIILNTSQSTSAIIETELQDTSELNRNKRQYPKSPLNNGLNKANIQELITKKSWVGEAGHPMNPTLQRQMTVLTENISHRILKWWWEGDKVKGVVETMDFGEGIRMRNYIRQELETAFSLRAVGPVKKTAGGDIVQDPLTVVTYDWVFIPSHRNSYQTKIIQLGNENGTMNERKNALQESYCLPILQESAINYIKDESKNYKLISECLEFDGEVKLSDSGKILIVESASGKNKDKLCIGIEKYIARDIENYFNKKF